MNNEYQTPPPPIQTLSYFIRRKYVEYLTRTHSMTRHRKTPRSLRNLMVIDPLTPSQGHQFDRRLKFFSVS